MGDAFLIQNIKEGLSLPDGSSPEKAALSGFQLAEDFPSLESGFYWIKSEQMPNALEMYVDMTEEGGGFDFYPIQNGTSFWTAFPNVGGASSPPHSGVALGLQFWTPRSKFHWRAATNFVRNVLNETGGNYQRYFRTTGSIHRTTSSNTSYVSVPMRDPESYGTGANDWRGEDGETGRWWLRDTTFGEPNGDYGAFGFLSISAGRVNSSGGVISADGTGGYSVPEPYALQDLSMNDIGPTTWHGTGRFYLVSTNAKP